MPRAAQALFLCDFVSSCESIFLAQSHKGTKILDSRYAAEDF